LKLSGKRTVTGQNSGELYTKKAPKGQLLIIRKKGQSKNSNIAIFILSFFIFIENMQYLSKADKGKLSQRIGRKVMGLRYCHSQTIL